VREATDAISIDFERFLRERAEPTIDAIRFLPWLTPIGSGAGRGVGEAPPTSRAAHPNGWTRLAG
jgi:hypothetical protein